MIATLTGKLKSKLNNQIIIDVNGVGYCLNVSKNTLDHIGDIDESVILKTDLQVRDDSILLYGFKFQVGTDDPSQNSEKSDNLDRHRTW